MKINEVRHAFATGASGIGLGIVEAMARRGIAVTVADVNEEALGRLALGDRVREACEYRAEVSA